MKSLRNEIIGDRHKLLYVDENVLIPYSVPTKLRGLKHLLLIYLCTYFPPRRVLYYAKMKYIKTEVEDNKRYNFYISDKKIFIFNR